MTPCTLKKKAASALTVLAAFVPSSLWAQEDASGSPRHDICADLPPYFGMGLSSYSDYGPDFIAETHENEGVNWNFVYLYVGPTGNRTDEDFITYVLAPKLNQAKDIGAMPVVTFYNLLRLGRDYSSPSLPGGEAEVVEAVLKNPALMREYFEDFAYILTEMDKLGGPLQMHVEPDSWGFMMWAFGIEGNDDAQSIEVAVESSGFPGLEDFENHAGDFGKALLHLRNTYAPDVRMGWHASNFRMNTRPEVVTGFYSKMGQWDLLVGEGGHINSGDWWDDLDEEAFIEHLKWHKEVTEAAGVPLLSWQRQIGFTDYHFMEATGDTSRIEDYARNGVIGFQFSLRSSAGDINDSRALEGDYGDIPPSGHPADGTAGAMRQRLSNYYQAPVAWPPESLCYGMQDTPGTGGAGLLQSGNAGAADMGLTHGTGGSMDSGPSDDDSSARQQSSSSDTGCSCNLSGEDKRKGSLPFLLGAWCAALAFQRRRQQRTL